MSLEKDFGLCSHVDPTHHFVYFFSLFLPSLTKRIKTWCLYLLRYHWKSLLNQHQIPLQLVSCPYAFCQLSSAQYLTAYFHKSSVGSVVETGKGIVFATLIA